MLSFFHEDDIRPLLHWPELFDTLQKALISFSSGHAIQPLRTVADLPSPQSCFFTMAAALSDPPSAGTKIVSICPHNAKAGLPTHEATLIMLDPTTGRVAAILDGTAITEARTAAVSALSVRALANPKASTLAIIGSGAQAHSHALALPEIHSFREIRAFSPTPAHLQRFLDAMDGQVKSAASAEAAVRDADVIVLATSSATPVIQKAWIKPGAHVISIGAPRPHQRELDPQLLPGARVFVDSREAALVESGDIVRAIAAGLLAPHSIAGELGAVIAGKIQGRLDSRDITIFKSLGMAIEDVAVGALLLPKLLAART